MPRMWDGGSPFHSLGRLTMELSLLFNDNGTGHNDIVLRFAGNEQICDSYYLVIDDSPPLEGEGATKIRAILWRLLKQWHDTLGDLVMSEVAFLPFDFSDQYTGWLRCTATNEGFDIVQGWSDTEGWSFAPSNVGSLLRELTGFRADGPTVQASRRELMDAINESLSHARAEH